MANDPKFGIRLKDKKICITLICLDMPAYPASLGRDFTFNSRGSSAVYQSLHSACSLVEKKVSELKDGGTSESRSWLFSEK
jgi:hypothetical protein